MGNAETITVFTYPTAADRDYALAHPVLGPQDAEAVIAGPHASLVIIDGITGIPWGDPRQLGPSPQEIGASCRTAAGRTPPRAPQRRQGRTSWVPSHSTR